MAKKRLSGGLVHDLPTDLEKAIAANPKALAAWEDISAIARNEWICWTISVKQDKTRQDHVKRTVSELAEGIRRPCCWLGCIHRTDKAMSPSQKYVLGRQAV
jgi:hypothetical protein